MKKGFLFGVFLIISFVFFYLGFVVNHYFRLKAFQSAIYPESLLLTEVSFHRKVNRDPEEVISKVRFIMETESPASVFFPIGENGGIGLAFSLKYSGKQVFLVGYSMAEKIWNDGTSMGKLQETACSSCVSNHNIELAKMPDGSLTECRKASDKDIQYGPGKPLSYNMEYILQQYGSGFKNYDINYNVTLKVEREVSFSELTHIESSLKKLDNKEIHVTNVAIPQIMTAGFEIHNVNDDKRYPIKE